MAAQQIITEAITRVRNEGIEKAISEATKLDKAYDQVAIASDKIEKTSLSAQRALERFNRSFEPGYAASQKMAQAQKDLGKALSQGLLTLPEYERKMRLVSGANDNVSKTLGLAGWQVRNLTNQFVDLGVQIGSGQGIFRPLLQQGPQIVDALGSGQNGIGGALKGIGAAIGSLPRLALAGFGAAGLAGAVGLAAAAVSNLRAEMDRLEAPIKALNSPSTAGGIIAGAKNSARGTNLNEGDLLGISQTANRDANRLGVQNAEALTRGAAQLSQALKATSEASRNAVAEIDKLLRGTVITGEQAVKFAVQFPQFADVIARTFDTTKEALLDLDPAIIRTSATLARNIAAVGEASGAAAPKAKDLGAAIADAALAFDKLTGLSGAWDGFWTNVSKGLGVLADGMNSWAASIENAQAKLASLAAQQTAITPSAANPMGGFQGSGSDQFGYGPTGLPIPYNQYGGYTGAGTSADSPGDYAKGGMRTPVVDPDQIGRAVSDAFDPLKQAVDNLPKVPDIQSGAETITNELKNTNQGFGSLERTYSSGVNVWSGKTSEADKNNVAGLKAVESAVNGLGGVLQSKYNLGSSGSSTPSLESQMQSAFDNNTFYNPDGSIKSNLPTAGKMTSTIGGRSSSSSSSSDPSGMSGGDASGMGGFTTKLAGGSSYMMSRLGFNRFVNWYGKGTYMASVLGGPRGSMGASGGGSGFDGFSPRGSSGGLPAEYPVSGGGASGASSNSLADLIGNAIDNLQQRQDAVMQRDYRPDPYSDKNPDMFYSGGKIFAAEQDKIWTGLQKQIEQLVSLKELAQKQASMFASFPDLFAASFTAALQKAGMTATDIARAMAGLTPSTTGTAQPGPLPNRFGDTAMRGLF